MNRILKIGIFATVFLITAVAFSVYVSDKPYWYRSCTEIPITVDDATGLRRKSPVRTLGLEIGYIKSVELDGDRVLIRVCVTGPVQKNLETRAYVRSSGFLGDKFLELKPMDKVGGSRSEHPSTVPPAPAEQPGTPTSSSAIPAIEIQHDSHSDSEDALPPQAKNFAIRALSAISNWIIPSAEAAEEPTLNASRDAELQDTVKKVGKLIDQLTLMIGDLREVTQQKEFKEMVINLSASMKHLEGMLRPDGKMGKNLAASVESMRATMASAEAIMNKVKEGEGTIGKFINDPSLYDDIRASIQSINLLLGKAGLLRTYVDIGAWQIPAYEGARGFLKLTIAPNPGRYYLIGITLDPRGRDTKTTTTTCVNNCASPTVVVETKNEEKGLKITAMFGKYFGPLDLSVGLMEDKGAVGVGYWLDSARRFGVHADIYSMGTNKPITVRAYAKAHIYSALYVTGGIDQLPKYIDTKGAAKYTYFGGVGLSFDDDDLKYLLAFK